MTRPSMREQAAATAVELFREDPATAIVLAEISVELFAGAFAHDRLRAVNLGIMEQAMVGVAAGFALEGMRPIVHTFAPFLAERALEQIKLDLGNQELPATLVSSGASYDYGTEGTTHHAPGDVRALLSIPGIEIAVPGAPGETDLLLRAAHASPAVSYVRTSVQRNERERRVAPGRIELVREGGRATVVAFGPMLDRTLAAVADLDVAVAYATTVAPFDGDGLAALAGPSPHVIAVEPFHEGTLAPLLGEALRPRPARVDEIGVPRRVLRDYGTPAQHDAALGLDAAGLHERIRGALAA